MQEKISLCGDNCLECPRYNVHTDEERSAVAELWYRVGWRDHVVSNEEIACAGCHPDKVCSYGLTDCTKQHGIQRCRQCGAFPCGRIGALLEKSGNYEKKCREVCTNEEYDALERAFFRKEYYLWKDEV